jgi:hypothetical protein
VLCGQVSLQTGDVAQLGDGASKTGPPSARCHAAEPAMNLEAEIAALRSQWPAEFKGAARCAFLRQYDGKREKGGYPLGFHRWMPDRRNAWFAGYNRGYHDRLRLLQEEAH